MSAYHTFQGESAMKKYLLLITLCVTHLSANAPLTRSIWQEYENTARHAVVQVVNYSETINVLEPFKPTHDEHQAGGSAFFINEDGEIITNYHVVAGAKRLYIMLPSINKRKRFEIELVGCKPSRDIALCRLTEKGKAAFTSFLETVPGCNGMIQYLELAPDDTINPLEPVMALGYPLIDGFKRTLGEVSGVSMNTGQFYCQITAPISNGNSGGPTLNKNGQVIGINTAGIPGAGAVGFMVPVRYLRNAIADLRTHKVLSLTLGATLLPTTQNVLDTVTCPESGLLVTKVLKETFADSMALQKGDIVMAINGYSIDNDGLITPEWIDSKVPYFDEIEATPVGEIITLKVWRNGKEVVCKAALPGLHQLTIDTVYPEQGSIAYCAFGGVILQSLHQNHQPLAQTQNGTVTNMELLQLLLDTTQHMKQRIVVTKVYAGTQAELEPALYPGALIDKINGHKVRTLADVHQALEMPNKVRTLADVHQALGMPNSDFVTIECFDNSRAALHIPTLFQEDEYLRDIHGYNVSLPLMDPQSS